MLTTVSEDFVLIHLIKLSQRHTQPDKGPSSPSIFAASQWLPLHLFPKLITRAPYLFWCHFHPQRCQQGKALLTRLIVLSGLRSIGRYPNEIRVFIQSKASLFLIVNSHLSMLNFGNQGTYFYIFKFLSKF